MSKWKCPDCGRERTFVNDPMHPTKCEWIGCDGELVRCPISPRLLGAQMIVAERERQINEEGYSRAGDDRYLNEQLAWAAAAYVVPSDWSQGAGVLWPDSWDRKHFKRDKHDRVRQLVIGAALVAAEIDRILALPEEAQAVLAR